MPTSVSFFSLSPLGLGKRPRVYAVVLSDSKVARAFFTTAFLRAELRSFRKKMSVKQCMDGRISIFFSPFFLDDNKTSLSDDSLGILVGV